MMMHSKSNKLAMWAIFLISPLLALLIAARNFKYKEYHLFIILFFAIYGYTYIPIPDSDVENHLASYRAIIKYNFGDLINYISNIYTAKSRNPDFYIEVVGYLT